MRFEKYLVFGLVLFLSFFLHDDAVEGNHLIQTENKIKTSQAPNTNDIIHTNSETIQMRTFLDQS